MKNALNNQVSMLGDMFLWLVANLKQGVIYFIKQALPPNISAGSVSTDSKSLFINGLPLVYCWISCVSVSTEIIVPNKIMHLQIWMNHEPIDYKLIQEYKDFVQFEPYIDILSK